MNELEPLHQRIKEACVHVAARHHLDITQWQRMCQLWIRYALTCHYVTVKQLKVGSLNDRMALHLGL
jgi:hypothetical protein